MPHALSRSLAYFPLIGALLGALLGGVDLLAREWLSPRAADALLLALLALATGALHLDGLADSADGLLAPGRDRAARLAIMRDAGIGAFGVLALLGVLLLKLAALDALPDAARGAALATSLALGRWAIVAAYACHRYARGDEGPSAQLKRGATHGSVGVATLTTLAASLLLGPAGPALCLAVGAAALVATRAMALRPGGVTGDVCGAACELAETFALLLAPVAVAAAG